MIKELPIPRLGLLPSVTFEQLNIDWIAIELINVLSFHATRTPLGNLMCHSTELVFLEVLTLIEPF